MRPETFIVACDYEGCSCTIRDQRDSAVRFTSHESAHAKMRAEGWYYDAKADLCPAHFPGRPPAEIVEAAEVESVFAGGAFHDSSDLRGLARREQI